ncbi:MAG: radical SAM protein [bacterium]|nr:radical SAM protein [bacterium]
MENKNKNPKIDYQLLVAVWEITMDCNMRCKHCGSSCEGPMEDELTTEEALDMCDQLGGMGLNRITLSGGEPFTRKDWPLLVERLASHDIKTNLLSNGWLLDRETIKKAAKAGVVNLGMSLDGLEETHDFIRRKGSYAQIMNALDIMKEEGMPVGIVTCIHEKNIGELRAMKEILVEKGVADWQLQSATPMGNMLEHSEWILDQDGMDRIIDIGHEFAMEGKIRIDLADDIGYFNNKEIEIRKAAIRDDSYHGLWAGCPAGKIVIGIRTNGDLIGCLSIRDDKYLEGSIREHSLKEIWTRPGAFSWNRDLTKNQLEGFCGSCQYGNYCLGGCAATKLLRYNTIGETEFCSFRHAIEKEKIEIMKINDFNQLVSLARQGSDKEEFQLADIYVSRALEMKPTDITLLQLKGYIQFNLENFPQCEAVNRQALELDPENAYTLKGLGVCLSNMDRLDEGVAYLRKSIERAGDDFLDPYFDLAAILGETGYKEEGLKVLEQGRAKSEEFKKDSQGLYEALKG